MGFRLTMSAAGLFRQRFHLQVVHCQVMLDVLQLRFHGVDLPLHGGDSGIAICRIRRACDER